MPINLKIIKDAGYAGQASNPDAGPSGPSRGKGKGGGVGGGKKGGGGLADVKTNLIAWWDFEEAGTARRVNAQGNTANDLKPNNSCDRTTDNVAGTYAFSTNGQTWNYLLGNYSGHTLGVWSGNPSFGTSDFAVCGWAKYTGSLPDSGHRLIGNTATTTDCWGIGHDGAGTVTAVVDDEVTGLGYSVNIGTITADTWHFYYFYWIEGDLEFGGSIDAGTVYSNNIPNQIEQNVINHYMSSEGTTYFPGHINTYLDSWAMWKKAGGGGNPTYATIEALYNGGSGVQWSDLP